VVVGTVAVDWGTAVTAAAARVAVTAGVMAVVGLRVEGASSRPVGLEGGAVARAAAARAEVAATAAGETVEVVTVEVVKAEVATAAVVRAVAALVAAARAAVAW